MSYIKQPVNEIHTNINIPEQQIDLVSALAEIRECYVCYNEMQVVYQRKDGHVICESCSKQVENCPLCGKGNSISIRNRALEEVLSLTKGIMSKMKLDQNAHQSEKEEVFSAK